MRVSDVMRIVSAESERLIAEEPYARIVINDLGDGPQLHIFEGDDFDASFSLTPHSARLITQALLIWVAEQE